MPFGSIVELHVGGQGGHAVPTGVANASAFPVTEWRGRKYAKLAEDTTSASGGEHRANILRGGQFTINVPWNATLNQQPESVGFREGNSMSLGLIIGAGGMWYTFPAIMEYIEIIVNAKDDVVRLTISGYCQGTWPDPVTQPA